MTRSGQVAERKGPVRMGRRSRARERATRPAPGRQAPGNRAQAAGPAPAARAGAAEAGRPGRRLLAALNPFGFQRPSRSRVRHAAVGFGLLAVVLAVLGWLTGTAGWFNSAVLLAILALAWGARAAFMGEDPPDR
jgi:hypothetical protein